MFTVEILSVLVYIWSQDIALFQKH